MGGGVRGGVHEAGEVKERAKVEALRMLSGMAESAAMRDESPGVRTI